LVNGNTTPENRRSSMKKLLILGAIAATLALAACGGAGNGGSDSATAAPSASAESVAVQQIGDAGSVLVDSSGHALYASDEEAGGKVLCADACESFWTPLTVSNGDPDGSVPGRLGVVDRPDGSEQVTYNGKPLYSFTEEGPGEVTGDGFVDAFDGREFTWSVVDIDSSGSSSDTAGRDSAPLGY
jgi:predicted lipoprotein with Yx(FWY)xxD motif